MNHIVESDIRESGSDAQERATRKSYRAPVLIVYGLVRDLTQGTLTVGTDTGPAQMNTQSDRDLKERIVRIDTHHSGIGLYLFDYRPEFREQFGTGRQFGVMADEVEQVMPQAVSVHPDGYKMVDYAMLGIRRHLQ